MSPFPYSRPQTARSGLDRRHLLNTERLLVVLQQQVEQPGIMLCARQLSKNISSSCLGFTSTSFSSWNRRWRIWSIFWRRESTIWLIPRLPWLFVRLGHHHAVGQAFGGAGEGKGGGVFQTGKRTPEGSKYNPSLYKDLPAEESLRAEGQARCQDW